MLFIPGHNADTSAGDKGSEWADPQIIGTTYRVLLALQMCPPVQWIRKDVNTRWIVN